HYFSIVLNGCNIVPTFPGSVVLKVVIRNRSKTLPSTSICIFTTALLILLTLTKQQSDRRSRLKADILLLIQCHRNPDHIKFSSLSNTAVWL
ncbi:unnamed protein product, partial [Porites evermanni]